MLSPHLAGSVLMVADGLSSSSPLPGRRGRFVSELLSSYGVSVARVAAWAIVGACIYRVSGDVAFAAFALARAAMTLVSYSSFGLAPAVVILLPKLREEEDARRAIDRVVTLADAARPTDKLLPDGASVAGQKTSQVVPPTTVLPYARPLPPPPDDAEARLLSTAIVMACVLTAVVWWQVSAYAVNQVGLGNEDFWLSFKRLIVGFAIAAASKVVGDVAGARSQVSGRMTGDNILQILVEVGWALWVYFVYFIGANFHFHGSTKIDVTAGTSISRVASTYAAITLAGVGARYICSSYGRRFVSRAFFDFGMAKRLIKTGFSVFLGQVADLLYAPANQLIIKLFLGATLLAVYAPTLMIDAALLLGVGGLSTLLLPMTAVAFARQDHAALRRYYVTGTLSSLGALIFFAIIVLLLRQHIFLIWFGDPMPATIAILPFVLIHTVIGGASGVGRSLLLGVGRARVYATAALVGGGANVAICLTLVGLFDLGLKAVVLSTVITVVARCAIWMPWYVMRTLKEESAGT